MSIEGLPTWLGWVPAGEVARSFVRSLRLPRHTANDGTVRVNVDLSEITSRCVGVTPSPGRL
jgi:hypothetical protein